MITEPNAVEATHHLQHGEVVRHVELVHGVRGIEDEVEGEIVWLVPVVGVCHNELLRAHLQCIFFLVWAVAEDVDFGAQRFCEENCEVAESTNTNDGDLLTWTGA